MNGHAVLSAYKTATCELKPDCTGDPPSETCEPSWHTSLSHVTKENPKPEIRNPKGGSQTPNIADAGFSL